MRRKPISRQLVFFSKISEILTVNFRQKQNRKTRFLKSDSEIIFALLPQSCGYSKRSNWCHKNKVAET